MREVAEGIKDGVGVAARPSRGAHAVENQAERLHAIRRDVKAVTRCVETNVWHPAAVHFREHRLKPARMLIVDANWPLRILQVSLRRTSESGSQHPAHTILQCQRHYRLDAY